MVCRARSATTRRSRNSATSPSGLSAKNLATRTRASRGTSLRCASPPPSTRGRSNAEKHRTTSKSGNSALKTARANVHQFCMRAKHVAATSSDTPLTSPIVLGWPVLVCNKRFVDQLQHCGGVARIGHASAPCEHKLADVFEIVQALGYQTDVERFLVKKRVNSRQSSAQSANIPIWSIA